MSAGEERGRCPGCESLTEYCRCRELVNRRQLVEEILSRLLDEPVSLKHVGNHNYTFQVRID